MAKDVSMVHVAKRAGVSLSTVSLVINRRPNVSPDTARRVRDAVEELGYKAVPRGSATRRPGRMKKTNRVALALLGQPRVLLSRSVYTDVVGGAEEALRERGLALVLVCVPDLTKFASLASRYSVDGMLLIGDTQHEAVLKGAWQHPCVKVMGSPTESDWFDQVCVDQKLVAVLAADYLLQRGHRLCAFIGRTVGVPEERRLAFGERIRNCGAEVVDFVDPDLIQMDSHVHAVRHEKMAALIDALISSSPRPTGLMVDSDTMLTSVYQCLLRRNIRPGEDIEILSCNNERDVLANLHPSPTVVDVQAADLGRRAVDQLIWRMSNREASREVIVVKPKLVISTEADSAAAAAPAGV